MFTRREWMQGGFAFMFAGSGVTIFEGTFQYWGGKGGREVRKKAVEDVVSEMPWLFQGIAKRRILETNPIPAEISFRGTRVSIAGMPTVNGPVDWTTFRWTDGYGESVKVRQRIRGRTLVQHFSGKEGSRMLTHHLQEDGKWLRFGLDLRSSKLPRPIQYKLWYLRR